MKRILISLAFVLGMAATAWAQVVSIEGTVTLSSNIVDGELPDAVLATNDIAIPTAPFVNALLYCGTVGVDVDLCVTSDKTFGTSTYTEATSTGTLTGGVRNDSLDSLGNTTNEVVPFAFNAEGALWSANSAAANGGCTVGTGTSIIFGASVNETAIKATAGQVYKVSAYSIDATPVKLAFYNDTTANIDETDTPVWRILIPANSTAALGAGVVESWETGMEFTTAITIRATTGMADNDTGATSAGEGFINVCYQ